MSTSKKGVVKRKKSALTKQIRPYFWNVSKDKQLGRIHTPTVGPTHTFMDRMAALKESDPGLFDNIRTSWFHDTQVIRLLLHPGVQNVNSTAAGVINNTYQFTLGTVVSASSLVIFDEFRIMHVSGTYMPAGTHIGYSGYAPGNLFALIDYDDTGAITSSNGAWQHTNCVPGNTSVTLHTEGWLMPLPDEDWETTATTTRVVATFKLYGSGLSLSLYYGMILPKMVVDFRVVQA